MKCFVYLNLPRRQNIWKSNRRNVCLKRFLDGGFQPYHWHPMGPQWCWCHGAEKTLDTSSSRKLIEINRCLAWPLSKLPRILTTQLLNQTFARWWFHFLKIFTPIWGNDPLVQPPTSLPEKNHWTKHPCSDIHRPGGDFFSPKILRNSCWTTGTESLSVQGPAINIEGARSETGLGIGLGLPYVYIYIYVFYVPFL